MLSNDGWNFVGYLMNRLSILVCMILSLLARVKIPHVASVTLNM